MLTANVLWFCGAEGLVLLLVVVVIAVVVLRLAFADGKVDYHADDDDDYCV